MQKRAEECGTARLLIGDRKPKVGFWKFVLHFWGVRPNPKSGFPVGRLVRVVGRPVQDGLSADTDRPRSLPRDGKPLIS